ncbi:hypothetical protein PSN45_003014 [Yamadazyma tenuis]|uniref:Fumarylacetoacetase-like C-terminal domain-containing protein n=1 Tax=Candida tenuis (strain ATCC 10573 / BCRC 21748 / CBS 615 / JCM 9827 / NBRC 10315 / NRRL Y-1498 / VKM Y-70) TaxID=590646 RepID=G3AXI4_CANTC|nr:uncharacterized protein CANTEDRAFT_96445 [Yamadazyma tenuis ATCC 10573]EGV66390.1 hypothetical protein CANTEDRAFT_96445 [Yamadazyma tenuis ATCC 10573]WEJ95494.1 hypothetical protein PSN45_003014 [Yamadazyma tenuis]
MTIESAQFKRLIRFVSSDGNTYFGDAILPEGSIDVYQCKTAFKINGDIFGDYQLTEEILTVTKLLSPLAAEQVPAIRCVGMNYIKHAIELKMQIPKYPVVFFKPTSAIVGPEDPILVPSACQIHGAKIDYEVEMVIVIGKTGRDIEEKDAQDYILGYTIGNDVSQRTWQMDRGGTQFGVGKMFDTFAPIGPAIISKHELTDTSNLRIYSQVNGEQRQDSNTQDMIFDVNKVVSFMSMGTTLKPGDIIFTGTPSGVAVGLEHTPYLVDGDEIFFHIDQIGNLKTKVEFEKPNQKILEYYT